MKIFSQNRNNKKRSQGFTIVETLVAVSILALVITGPVVLLFSANESTQESANRIIASFLAQDAIEYIIAVKQNNNVEDQNFLSGLGPCNDARGCIIDTTITASDGIDASLYQDQYLRINGDNKYQYTDGDQSAFRRRITIENTWDHDGDDAPDEARISAEVLWSGGGSAESRYVLKTNIYDSEI